METGHEGPERGQTQLAGGRPVDARQGRFALGTFGVWVCEPPWFRHAPPQYELELSQRSVGARCLRAFQAVGWIPLLVFKHFLQEKKEIIFTYIIYSHSCSLQDSKT